MSNSKNSTAELSAGYPLGAKVTRALGEVREIAVPAIPYPEVSVGQRGFEAVSRGSGATVRRAIGEVYEVPVPSLPYPEVAASGFAGFDRGFESASAGSRQPIGELREIPVPSLPYPGVTSNRGAPSCQQCGWASSKGCGCAGAGECAHCPKESGTCSCAPADSYSLSESPAAFGAARAKPVGPQKEEDHGDYILEQSAVWSPADGERPGWFDADAHDEWKGLSYVMYAARHFGMPSSANTELERAIAADPMTPFAPLYGYWVMENFMAEGRFEEALEAAEAWERRWPRYRFEGEPLLGTVLRKSTRGHALLNEPAAAESTIHRWIRLQESTGREDAEPWFELGRLAEEHGDTAKAIWAYREAGRRPGRELVSEYSRRNADRLGRRTIWVRQDPQSLARELLHALRRKDEGALTALASETHFSFGGVGGHYGYTEPATVLPLLFDDLRVSKIHGDPDALQGAGAKRYLITKGWNGRGFVQHVHFMLRQVRGGWEWSGVAIIVPTPRTTKLHREVFGEAEPKSNQHLEIPIRAPWRRGFSFQAGGLGVYGSTIGFLPPIGFGIAAVIGGARECGFGPGGFYYNNPPHENKAPYDDGVSVRWNASDDQFAVDFSRWERGNPFPANLSANHWVLACAAGRIREAHGDETTGGGPSSNFVEHRLYRRSRPTVYTARYIHLDGPSRLGVVVGMYVGQGWVLGRIDDTGASVHDHLHFEVHDSRLGNDWDPTGTLSPLGRTVRLNPIDRDQGLGDGDDSVCVMSSNVPFVPSPDDCNNALFVDDEADAVRLPYRTGPVPEPVRRFLESVFHRPCRTAAPPPIHCPPPTVACFDRYCADLSRDPANCGVCGRNCGVDELGRKRACESGECPPLPEIAPELAEQARRGVNPAPWFEPRFDP